MIPKYALLEIERRWLVDPARAPPLDLARSREIIDLYIDGGRLRLRTVTEPGGGRVFKLCKKYERDDALGGPIVNIYLSAEEHAVFAGLPGRRLVKQRHAVQGFSIDVLEDGVMLAEQEYPSTEAAMAAQAPDWALREVTDDPAFRGDSLALRLGR